MLLIQLLFISHHLKDCIFELKLLLLSLSLFFNFIDFHLIYFLFYFQLIISNLVTQISFSVVDRLFNCFMEYLLTVLPLLCNFLHTLAQLFLPFKSCSLNLFLYNKKFTFNSSFALSSACAASTFSFI